MKRGKKLLALLLALTMLLALAACGGKNNTQNDPDTQQSSENNPGNEENNTPAASDTYTLTYGKSIPSNWNPHTAHDTSQTFVYNAGLTDSLYRSIFNDSLHPVEGVEDYEGYVFLPSMAADFPVDVTAKVKAEHPDWIPESATQGYAWSVKLRDDLKWDDGTPITAQDFVDSLERLLRPELLNYNSISYYTSQYAVVNAREYALSGQPVFQSFDAMGTTLKDFLADGHSEDEVYINMSGFWNVKSADNRDQAAITDDTMVRDAAVAEGEDEDYVSAKYLYETYLADGMPSEASQGAMLGTVTVPYEAGFSFDNVGLYISGDNELTFVLNAALAPGYHLYTALSVSLVKTDVYDACLTETETASGSVWSSTYMTNVDTSPSFGPYKLVEYQQDKLLHFQKNENWSGWGREDYKYADPVDGQVYEPFQATDIIYTSVTNQATTKQMFLAGQLTQYNLAAEDYAQYRNSEYTVATPGQAIAMYLVNGKMDTLTQRENAADFDKTTTDAQTQALPSFRAAINLSIDREALNNAVLPSNTVGYGMLGPGYIVDPDTGVRYRDTDQAKQALCNAYNIDVADYGGDLTAAADAITGFDPVKAKELYTQAFNEALELGYITDEDGDGISDQTVTMIYGIGSESETNTQRIEAFNEQFKTATIGTPFEGKFEVVKSTPLGSTAWESLFSGAIDTLLPAWTGGHLDPYAMADTWTDPDQAFWGNAWDASKEDYTYNYNGTDVTMSIRDWARCLNGTMITAADGKDYNFGYGQADVETRVDILAFIESAVLSQHLALPVTTGSSEGTFMLSQQVYYVVDSYSSVMARGGTWYLKFNYSDAEWAEYVASQGGTLQY